MPWKESSVMDERVRFIAAARSGRLPLAVLCRRFGISRVTGYKWMRRFEREGPEGLNDRSRAPHHHPNAVSARVVELIVQMRRRDRLLGPRKLRQLLIERRIRERVPSASTIAEILRRHGLTSRRKRRRRTPADPGPLQPARSVNQIWSADFKGWFATRDGQRCDILTVLDQHSRYAIRCPMIPGCTGDWTRAVFEAAFGEYGLPQTIRTDNGAPFATRGVAGLSKLSVWWLRLGISRQRIRPGHPQDNGAHERFHQTLKSYVADPPRAAGPAQQRALSRFRDYYNSQRPHEALEQATPASRYAPSPRPLPERLPEPDYPRGFLLRRVQVSGEFYWRQGKVFLGEALGKQTIGLQGIDGRYYRVYFMQEPIAIFDERGCSILKPAQLRRLVRRLGERAPTVSPGSPSETVGAGQGIENV